MFTVKRVGLTVLLLVVLVWGGYMTWSMTRPEPTPLRIAVNPAEDVGTTYENTAPWIEYMSDCLDMGVELFVGTDYTAVIEAAKYGHADVVKLGPFAYIMGVEEADIEAVAKAVRKSGAADYRAIIIARADSGITSLEDLQGKTFAFTDPASTSGYLAPMTGLRENGIEVGETLYAGSHPAIIEVVKAGQVDAGATAYETIYLPAIEEGVITEEEVIVVWMSDPIPASPISVKKSMDPELKIRVAECIKATPREIVELFHFERIQYIAAQDSDYDFIRQMARYKE